LLLGVFVGGSVLAMAVVAPLRRRLRRAEQALRDRDARTVRAEG
jgi:hypothetical protein